MNTLSKAQNREIKKLKRLIAEIDALKKIYNELRKSGVRIEFLEVSGGALGHAGQNGA